VGVVCLGTSRFFLAINAPMAQEYLGQASGGHSVAVFNGSIPSGDYDTAGYLLEQMNEHGWQPSLVMLEMSPELVSCRNPLLGSHVLPSLTGETWRQYPADLWRSGNVKFVVKPRLLPVFSCRRSLRGEGRRQLDAWSADEAAASTRRRAPAPPRTERQEAPPGPTPMVGPSAPAPAPAVAAAVSDPPQPTSTREMLFPDGDPSPGVEQERATGLARIREWLADYQVGGGACVALERLLCRCRDHGAAVVLVAPPVCAAQRTLYSPEIEAAFRAYVWTLEATYQCAFLDYRGCLPDSQFFDNQHVFADGSMAFTAAVTKDVVAPSWSRMANGRGMPTADAPAKRATAGAHAAVEKQGHSY
jgi:hypothetical protein